MTATRILRVLTGRLAGTERTLPDEGRVSIGHQFWQDVVLRDPATRGIAVELVLDGDGGAGIAVLEGEAVMLGSVIPVGGTAILPPYVPLTVGGVAIAWGEPDSERWDEANGLAAALPAPADTPATMRDEFTDSLRRAGEGAGRVFTSTRVRLVAAAVGLVVLASVTMPVVDALNLRGDPADRVERAMARAGVEGIDARLDHESGQVLVTGVVPNPGQRAKATSVLADSGVPGRLQVQTSAELAGAAADVARIHGLQATARPIARTAVELRVTPLAPEQQQALALAVRGDVPRLTRLDLRDDLPPREEKPPRTVQDATKKVSTVVAGDPAFIQTVDGARYFTGAMMPSGHRLVAIQGNAVLLEKNGRETRVTF